MFDLFYVIRAHYNNPYKRTVSPLSKTYFIFDFKNYNNTGHYFEFWIRNPDGSSPNKVCFCSFTVVRYIFIDRVVNYTVLAMIKSNSTTIYKTIFSSLTSWNWRRIRYEWRIKGAFSSFLILRTQVSFIQINIQTCLSIIVKRTLNYRWISVFKFSISFIRVAVPPFYTIILVTDYIFSFLPVRAVWRLFPVAIGEYVVIFFSFLSFTTKIYRIYSEDVSNRSTFSSVSPYSRIPVFRWKHVYKKKNRF